MKLGKAFSDSVIAEKKKYMRENRDDGDSWWLGVGRVLIFVTILCVGFFILIWRLFDLSVVQGHHFRTLADGNRTRELIRHAPRGILRDRTGKPLVENIPYYRLIKPCAGSSGQDCVITLSRDAGDTLAKTGLQPGSFLEVDYRRHYLTPVALSQVIGFTGELSENELKDQYYTLRSYRRGDRVGRTGAEAVFEDKLRGRDGKELVEVDAKGTIVRTLGRDKEIAGVDITLSIDASLEQAAYEAFPKNEKGAVIVSRPATGEILALYSAPSFDLNSFSDGLSEKDYNDLVGDPDKPMFNRAIGGVYPPGSTFKIVTSLAALEEGAIKRDTVVEDVGVLTIGPFRFPNWYFQQYGKTEGLVNVVRAIKRSNDIFFYKTGEWVGISKLAAWAHTVGIGKPLGIELGGEASGLMPDPVWKKKRFSTEADREAHNDEWYVGDTYHVAIGQGYLLVTPLQVNVWTNVIANRGAVCRPTIQKAERTASGISRCKEVVIKSDTISLITEGMREACDTGGTGWPLFNFSVIPAKAGIQRSASPSGFPVDPRDDSVSIPVACKTGTAEFGDLKNNTHAWFTVFAPLPEGDQNGPGTAAKKKITGDPEISVTILVEGAGEGSNVAAPVAKKILEAWFSR